MYRVFAEFDSRGAADRAADRLRSTAPGLGRISVRLKRRYKDNHNEIDSGDFIRSESALFSPNTFYQNCASPLIASLNDSKNMSHEQYYEPSDSQEHIICAEGLREPVERASQLLRSFGGINIIVSGSGE